MHDFLIIGTFIGLLLGLMHTVYLVKIVGPGGNTATSTNWLSALNYCAWALLLWFLLGAYVIGFWLIGCVFWLVFKAFRP